MLFLLLTSGLFSFTLMVGNAVAYYQTQMPQLLINFTMTSFIWATITVLTLQKIFL